ncbi:alkaline phosphatase [Candidatus Poribacteria bacterium]|nr:alkaline phosphatase [Candidatus Poribacteria bacterium]
MSRTTRRQWVKQVTGLVAMAAAGRSIGADAVKGDDLTFGVITDAHYADRDTAGTRHYRDSKAKVRQAVDAFIEAEPAFCVHLGDLVDKGETVEAELSYLATIEAEYARFPGPRHYVFGNHDVATLTKAQYLENCAARERYYSFDGGGFHFVVLDACYNEDESDYEPGAFTWTETYIPTREREWLREDLAVTDLPTVVLAHQRLDGDDDPHGVRNAALTREILEASGQVRAVFQGHDHRGAHNVIEGIDYVTLRAVVEGPGLENNAYTLVYLDVEGGIEIHGHGRQESLTLAAD